MARLRRVHIPGGIHYIILHGSDGRTLFCDDADYSHFTRLIERGARACQIRVFAFCWTPHEAHLAVQVSSVPLGRFIQPATGQHARYMNRKLGTRGHLFRARYSSVLLRDPESLPAVVARIHLTPVRTGLAVDLANYRWSSHSAYLGFEKPSWITTGTVFRQLETPGVHRRSAYRGLITQELVRLLQQQRSGHAADHHRADDSRFLRALSPPRRKNENAVMLNRIIDCVADQLDVPRDEILSPSRRRRLSLARALVAWYATNNDVATLTQVAHCLHRKPSTLCVGVGRYRHARKDLFDKPIDELLAVSASPAALLGESATDRHSEENSPAG